MKDDNCIFCKLANGEIPTATLYEDEDFRVILDLGPASKGHALILPKRMRLISMRYQMIWLRKHDSGKENGHKNDRGVKVRWF